MFCWDILDRSVSGSPNAARSGSSRRAVAWPVVTTRTSPSGSRPSSPRSHGESEGYNSADEQSPCFASSYDDLVNFCHYLVKWMQHMCTTVIHWIIIFPDSTAYNNYFSWIIMVHIGGMMPLMFIFQFSIYIFKVTLVGDAFNLLLCFFVTMLNWFQERERQFEIDIRRVKGFEVKRMMEDGNCLFRAVADRS